MSDRIDLKKLDALLFREDVTVPSPMVPSKDGSLINFNNLMGKIIILEGPISIGKTTLGFSIMETLQASGRKVFFMEEYVNKPLLDLYLNDRRKYAFMYQIMALRERFHLHRRAMELANAGYLVLIDRGITGDLMFATMQRDEGYFSKEEWQVYWDTLQQHKKHLFRPDLVIYLNCPAAVAFERLKKRGDEAEIRTYDQGYFESLEKACKVARAETNQEAYSVDLDWTEEDEGLYQNKEKEWRLSPEWRMKFLIWMIEQLKLKSPGF